MGHKEETSFQPQAVHDHFPGEIYAIKACIRDSINRNYNSRNICIVSVSQAALRVLDSFQINSKLVWDCLQSVMILAEHNSATGMGTTT